MLAAWVLIAWDIVNRSDSVGLWFPTTLCLDVDFTIRVSLHPDRPMLQVDYSLDPAARG